MGSIGVSGRGKMIKKKLLLVAMSVAVLAAACGGNGNDDAADGNKGSGSGDPGRTEVFIAAPSEPSSLDPQLRDDQSERMINDQIYETLLTRDASGEIVPLLAAEMPLAEGNRWRITLREGITFTNGEPFNADSVVATLARITDPAYETGQTGFLGGITGAEKIDDTTVEIVTDGDELDAVVPARLTALKMIPAEGSQDADFAESPVGTGPYMLESYTPGQEAVLVRNEDYWGENPSPITKVTIRPIADPSTRLAALQAGEIDIMTGLSSDVADQVPRLAEVPAAESINIRINAEKEGSPLQDVRVRQALNYAIDKEAIAEDLWGGFAEPLKCQTVPPAAIGHNASLEAYPYDPELAKELISEAGAEGATIEFMGMSGLWAKDKETSEVLAGYLAEIGLNLDFKAAPLDTYLKFSGSDETRKDLMYHSSSNDISDADRQVGAYYMTSDVTSGYSNPEVDALGQQARTTADPEERQALYEELLEITCEDAALVYVVGVDVLYGLSEEVIWEPRPDQKVLVKEISF